MADEPQSKQEIAFAESNRKTKAFYATLATIVILFVGTPLWHESPQKVIENVIYLATVYIGGLTINDTVRYYKFGSNTLGDPEKQNELQKRYGNK